MVPDVFEREEMPICLLVVGARFVANAARPQSVVGERQMQFVDPVEA